MSWRKWISIVLACLSFGGIVHLNNDLLIIIAYIVTLLIAVVLHERFKDKISKIEDKLLYFKNLIFNYTQHFLPHEIRQILLKLIEVEEVLKDKKYREAEEKIKELEILVQKLR